MAKKMSARAVKKLGFEISISGRPDGTLEAVYLTLRDGRVAKTDEIIEDVLLADYDSKGRLVGIEILGPVRISKVVPLVDRPRRDSFRKFISTLAPRELLVA